MGTCSSTSASSAYVVDAPTANEVVSKAAPPSSSSRPLLGRHSGGASDVSVCPRKKGRYFFSCGEDRTILLNDGTSGRVAEKLEAAHDGTINRLLWLDEHDLLASSSRDRTIRLSRWDYLASSDDNNDDTAAAAAASVAATGITSSPSSRHISTLSGHDLTVTALAGCGPYLASGSRDTTVRIWDIASGRQCSRAHRPQNLVTCLAWLQGGVGGDTSRSSSSGGIGGSANVLLQGSEDLRVRLWDIRMNNLLGGGEGGGMQEAAGCIEGFVYFPLAMDVSPCSRYLLTSSKGFNGVGCEARIWDLRALGWKRGEAGTVAGAGASGGGSMRGPLLHTYVGHTQDTTACKFLPSSALLKHGMSVASGGDADRKEEDKNSSAAASEAPPTAPRPTQSVSASYPPLASDAFLTASKDGSIRLWSASVGGLCLAEYADPGYAAYTSISLFPLGSRSSETAAEATTAEIKESSSLGESGDAKASEAAVPIINSATPRNDAVLRFAAGAMDGSVSIFEVGSGKDTIRLIARSS